MTEFRLLGAVEVWSGGQRLEAGQPRQRSLLAALLVDAGRVVSPASLVDRVWGDAPPGLRMAATITLASHLGKLDEEGRLPDGVEEPVLPTLPTV